MQDSEILFRLETYIRDREAHYLERLARLASEDAPAEQRQRVMMVANTYTEVLEASAKIRKSLQPERVSLGRKFVALFGY